MPYIGKQGVVRRSGLTLMIEESPILPEITSMPVVIDGATDFYIASSYYGISTEGYENTAAGEVTTVENNSGAYADRYYYEAASPTTLIEAPFPANNRLRFDYKVTSLSVDQWAGIVMFDNIGLTVNVVVRYNTTNPVNGTFYVEATDFGEATDTGWIPEVVDLTLLFPSDRTWTTLGVALSGNGNAAIRNIIFDQKPSFSEDDFNTTSLNYFWQFIDPQNDSSYSLNGSQLTISVVQGAWHTLFNNIKTAPRVMQTTEVQNYAIVAKFDSNPNDAFQAQGILVELDTDNWFKFEIQYNGSERRFFVTETASAISSTIANAGIPSATNHYQRVTRSGTSWTVEHSTDGTSWTLITNHTSTFTTNSMGLYCANFGSNPAFDMVVDNFSVTAL